MSYIPEGRDADQMVIAAGRAEGLRIDGDVAARLATACANNQAIVTQEVAKFALFLDSAPDRVRVSQGGGEARLALAIDAAVPDGCVRIARGIPETAALGEGAVTLEKVAVEVAA